MNHVTRPRSQKLSDQPLPSVPHPLYWWRLLRRPRTVLVDGLIVEINDKVVSPQTRRALWRGRYERLERAIVTATLRSTDRVLEGGGGLGVVAMTINRIVGDGSLVVYEPWPPAIDEFRKNVAANGMAIELVPKALAARSGVATYALTDDHLAGGIVAGRLRGREVAIETEDIVAAIERHKPNVLVLDVEGAESQVLMHCPLERVDLIIFEQHPDILSAAEVEGIHRHLLGAGFARAADFCLGQVAVFAKPSRWRSI